MKTLSIMKTLPSLDQTLREQVHYLPAAAHFSGAELVKLTDRVYT